MTTSRPHNYERRLYSMGECKHCGRPEHHSIHERSVEEPASFGGVFSALLQGAIRLHEEYSTLVEAGYTKEQAIELQKVAIQANITAAAMMKIAGIDPETGERK